VEAILKQRAMLQVNLVVQNLVAVFRVDSEVLVILTASLDLQSLEVSVVLQVSHRARLHLFLILTALVDLPVDLGAVLHRLPARLVLVAIAILKASLRLIRLVVLVAPVLPASPAHRRIVEQ
jgi:hypothetical protein